jgi:hypothetical protein
MRNIPESKPIITGLLLILFQAHDVRAVDVQRQMFANASAHCQSALPAFEQLLRKRPAAIQNEGSDAVAFVTCSFITQREITLIIVKAASIDGATKTISCTGVNGTSPDLSFVAKTVKTSSVESMVWLPGDFGGESEFPSFFFSISCGLPPQGALREMQLTFKDRYLT